MLEGCILPLVEDECCWANICWQCFIAFAGSSVFEFNVHVAHIITAICLMTIAFYNFYLFFGDTCVGPYSRVRPSDYDSNDHDEDPVSNVSNDSNDKTSFFPWMRLNNALYAFVTVWFGVFRSTYQLGKPLAIGAALHNLCEWGFMSYIFFRYASQRRLAFLIALIFIWFVILLVVSIPTFPEYLIVVQVTGIALDFCLPMLFVILYTQARKANKAQECRMWMFAIFAHWIHLFGTIIPLVIENFVVGQSESFSTLLEFLIAFSSPVTHILYTRWVTLHTEIIKPNNVFAQRMVVSKPECIVEKFDVDDNRINSGRAQSCLCMLWFLFAAFLGLFPTTIIPAAIGECDHETDDNYAIATNCKNTDDAFYGIAVANLYDGMDVAFENLVFHEYDLINTARQYEGNIFYLVIQSNSDKTQYKFFQKWESIDRVTEWAYNALPATVFSDPAVIAMLKGGRLEIPSYTGYSGQESCTRSDAMDYNYNLGAVRFSLNDCDLFWADIANISNCRWVKDCVEVTNIIDDNATGHVLRTLIFEDGESYQETRILTANSIQEIKYVLYTQNLNATIQVSNSNNSQCQIYWTFNINYQQSLKSVYSQFYVVTIPYLQSIYYDINL